MVTIKKSELRNKRIITIAIFVAAMVIYFAFGCANLGLPGPQNDEVADAVPALELLRHLPNTAFDTIAIWGEKLPLMMGHYIGPTSIYVSYLGMALFGTTITGLRISQLLLGALTLVLLYVFARRWLSPLIASVGMLLCATTPVFIWWSRAGIHFALPILPIALLFFLSLHTWWQSRRQGYLILAALFFGIGLTTKLLFIWLLVPISITCLLISGVRNTWQLARFLPLKTYVLSLFSFCLGLAPFIVHNLPSGASFRFIVENAVKSRAYGHNNLDFIGNIQFEALDFLRMIGGNTLHFDAPSGLPISAVIMVIVLFYTGFILLRYRTLITAHSDSHSGFLPTGKSIVTPMLPYLRLRLFLFVIIITVIPLGTISISDIGARHLFIILPLASLLVAISIGDFVLPMDASRRSNYGVATAIGVIAILVSNNSITNTLIENHLVVSGGTGLWSDSLYTLSKQIETAYASRPVMAIDWGFERSIAFITQGNVYVKEMYEYLPEPSLRFADTASVMLREPNNLYLFHTPEFTAFKGHFEVLSQVAAKAHKRMELIGIFKERNGITNTLVYQAAAVSRSFTISPSLVTRNAVFAQGLLLLGGEVSLDSQNKSVFVNLHWQSTAPTQPDDTVLLHIVNQTTGEVVMNGDQQPVYGSYPFSNWQRFEVVDDPHWISLPPQLTPGIYQVRVGVYSASNGARRSIDDPRNDAAGNSLMLNSFEIK